MKNTSNSKLLFELAFIKIISENSNQNVEKLAENPQKNNGKEKQIISLSKQSEKNEETQPKSEQKPNKNQESTPKNHIKNIKENEKIKELKKIRIDNTLAYFNKQEMRSIIQKLEKLNDLLLNPDYSHAASILLDGTLKAASDKYLIFIYKTDRLSNLFNENLLVLEETIAKILNKKYNLIATDINEWETIKNELNKKLRSFVYKEEPYKLEDIFKNDENTDNIQSMFEDIIEYN